MPRTRLKFIHEGRYTAEVSVERGEEGAWALYLSLDDVRKLEAVRLALRRGDIAEAAKYGRIFELKPISTRSACAEAPHSATLHAGYRVAEM